MTQIVVRYEVNWETYDIKKAEKYDDLYCPSRGKDQPESSGIEDLKYTLMEHYRKFKMMNRNEAK